MNLAEAVQHAKPGDTLTLPAGTYEGPVEITRPLTIKGAGAGKTRIDAKNLGACILVNHPNAELKLSGVTLVNGSSGAGGGIAYLVGKRLEVEDCVIENSTCKQYGGGGAFLVGPSALFTRVRIEGCVGSQGGALLLDEECSAELRACLIIGNAADRGGGIRVTEGARLKLVHCTVADNVGLGKTPRGSEILVSGTQSRTPEVAIINCIIASRRPTNRSLEVLGKFPGRVSVTHSLLPEADKESLKGEGVLYAVPEFLPLGMHRQKLSPSSPAAGAADPRLTPPGLKDFLGAPLCRGAEADMGAYAAL